MRAEEGAFRAETLVNASLAQAALFVPDLSAWAFVHNDGLAINLFIDWRNATAHAFAVSLAPEVTLRTALFVASALALSSIPVVRVVFACLGLTNVGALFSVPGHDATIVVGVRSLEDTNAFLAIPVVVFIASVLGLDLTVVHVEVLIFFKGASEHATAMAFVIAPEE